MDFDIPPAIWPEIDVSLKHFADLAAHFNELSTEFQYGCEDHKIPMHCKYLGKMLMFLNMFELTHRYFLEWTEFGDWWRLTIEQCKCFPT